MSEQVRGTHLLEWAEFGTLQDTEKKGVNEGEFGTGVWYTMPHSNLTITNNRELLQDLFITFCSFNSAGVCSSTRELGRTRNAMPSTPYAAGTGETVLSRLSDHEKL
jgi:hypothetical protein